jgi:hypothetical protein
MTPEKDYAFASGGIMWKIMDRSKYEGKSLKNKVSLVIGLMLFCWVPLAIISFIQLGREQFYLLFIRDIATHVRFILVLPILLFARQSLNKSFNNMISTFHETKIIDQENSEGFEKVIEWLIKWRNSWVVDILLIILVYSAFFVQQTRLINESGTYAPWLLYENKITAAGWWYLIFSLPIIQMLLYRWLFTIFLWIIFLRKISKLDLHLSALHPDGMGGLGFMKYTQIGYFPVAFAFSSLTAGALNNILIFTETSIHDYKVLIGSLFIFVLLLFILPLLVFVPLLSAVKRKYFLTYSLQAWPFARKYEEELKEFYKTEENKPDSSWHVDMADSFEKTANMKIVLIDKTILAVFIIAVVLPFLAVIAQEIPLRDVIFMLASKFLG